MMMTTICSALFTNTVLKNSGALKQL